jgi:hypothetical protein
MKKGEKWILIGIAVFAVGSMLVKGVLNFQDSEKDRGIPFYSSASPELAKTASTIIRKYSCRDCHSLWSKKNIMQSVPAPSLDGLGSFYTEEWFFDYFSAKNPQSIVPTRLKEEFRMPSFADIPELERRTLAQYMASLKVKDWYMEDTKKSEYEKLKGEKYQP